MQGDRGGSTAVELVDPKRASGAARRGRCQIHDGVLYLSQGFPDKFRTKATAVLIISAMPSKQGSGSVPSMLWLPDGVVTDLLQALALVESDEFYKSVERRRSPGPPYA